MSEKQNNVLTFKGNEYKLILDSLLFDENTKLLRRKWTLLEEEEIQDIDQSVIDVYQEKLDELDLTISSFQGTLTKEEIKSKDGFIKKRADEKQKMDSDLKVKSIRRLIKKRMGFVSDYILKDMVFLKSVFVTIFTGDLNKLDLKRGDPESILFASEALQLFFSSSPKSNAE